MGARLRIKKAIQIKPIGIIHIKKKHHQVLNTDWVCGWIDKHFKKGKIPIRVKLK